MNELLKQAIPNLAKLYDLFTYGLDPDSTECEQAEIEFNIELANLRDLLKDDIGPKKIFEDDRAFRREVIRLCKAYLRSQDRRG